MGWGGLVQKRSAKLLRRKGSKPEKRDPDADALADALIREPLCRAPQRVVRRPVPITPRSSEQLITCMGSASRDPQSPRAMSKHRVAPGPQQVKSSQYSPHSRGKISTPWTTESPSTIYSTIGCLRRKQEAYSLTQDSSGFCLFVSDGEPPSENNSSSVKTKPDPSRNFTRLHTANYLLFISCLSLNRA